MTRIVLESRGLSRQFAGFMAVRNVSIRVRENSIHALIGPNGAGKTTCFNLFTRFLSATSGTIHFDGVDITRSSPAQVAQLGLVRSFQISAVFPHLTVLDNMLVALERRTAHSFGFWKTPAVLSPLVARAEEILASVGLSDLRDSPAVGLSYGRKKALEIAMTLALDPRLLLLDEPMAGLGAEDIARMVALIREIAQGRTVLMVEHNMRVVSDLCNAITVLQRGEVLAEGTYDEVSANPRVVEAYIGSKRDAKARA